MHMATICLDDYCTILSETLIQWSITSTKRIAFELNAALMEKYLVNRIQHYNFRSFAKN